MAVSGRVAVVDANVLYSIELTDLLLTFAAHRLVRMHSSHTILDEVRRNLAKRADLTPDAIAYRIDPMNRAVPGALEEAWLVSLPVAEKRDYTAECRRPPSRVQRPVTSSRRRTNR